MNRAQLFLKAKQAINAALGIELFGNLPVTLTEEQKADLDAKLGKEAVDQFITAYNASLQEDDAAKNEFKAAMDAMAALKDENAELRQENERLASEAVPEVKAVIPSPAPAASVADAAKKYVASASDKFLFGQAENELLAIDSSRPWNQRAHLAILKANGVPVNSGAYESLISMKTDTSAAQLQADFGKYKGVYMREINAMLNNVAEWEKVPGFVVQNDVKKGEFNVNMFLKDFSQARQKDYQAKGAIDIQGQPIELFDIKIDLTFEDEDIFKMEDEWVNFLMTPAEYSKMPKLDFVFWFLYQIAKEAYNESNIRMTNGVYKAPVTGVAGNFINAANGLRRFIKQQILDFRLQPFNMGYWGKTNDDNIVLYLSKFVGKLPEWVRESANFVIYVSHDVQMEHNEWWRKLYGTNVDFTAKLPYVKDFENIKIHAIPMAGSSKRVIGTFLRNGRINKRGSLSDFQVDVDKRNVHVFSDYKEGIQFAVVGKKYASAALFPSDYRDQFVFVNDVDEPMDVYELMTKDDATPSAAYSKSLVSAVNTAKVAITNIDDTVTGDVIRLKQSTEDATKGIQLANSGNFVLTAAWDGAAGEIIELVKRADGKFIELYRGAENSGVILIPNDEDTPSLAGGEVFQTSANTGATAITDLLDAEYGKVYTIYGAGSTNASTIANSGNFVLTAAMTLSAGKSITLVKRKFDDKFVEISRV